MDSLCRDSKSQFVCDLVDVIVTRMLIIEDKAELLEADRPRRESSPPHNVRISSRELTAKLKILMNNGDDYFTHGSILPGWRYGEYRRSPRLDVISVQRSIDTLRSDVLQRHRQV